MSLLNISEKIEPLDLEIVATISNVADQNEIDFFMVGAKARDFVFELGYGIASTRRTEDMDLGIQVANWDQYKILIEALVSETGFKSDNRQNQRLRYKQNQIVDLMPFGSIAGETATITWPPDHEFEMNMMGFEEAFQHAQVMRLSNNPTLEVKFASPSGLTLLKIISWKTGGEDRKQRDAEDLKFLMNHYHQCENQDRIFDEGIMEQYDYQDFLAGSHLLGRDVSEIAKPQTQNFISEILENETDESGNLALLLSMTADPLEPDKALKENLILLKAFSTGFSEA